MSRTLVLFTFSFVLFSAGRALGIDVCFVNDSDRPTKFTVISGEDRFEKLLQPKSHEFVSVEDTKHDRVVIAQILNESDASSAAGSIKVVGVKTVLNSLGGRWNFCFVHGTAAEGISMDLFGFVCLDVVPHNWHQEPSDERYPLVRAQLMESMKNTRDVAPDSISNLRKSLWHWCIPSTTR